MKYLHKPLAIIALGLFFFLRSNELTAQALPITIDGQYGDWTTASAKFEDATGDVTGLDLLNFSVANDEKYLFIRLEIDEEVVLTDNNTLTLFIDGDNNNQTGLSANGIGAELELRFGDLEGRFYFGNSSTGISLEAVGFHHLPNFSNEVFEMAIARDAMPSGFAPLFSSNTIKLYFRNGVTGDKMPNQGQTFSYQFDSATVEVFQPIDLQKLSPSHIRLLTWNTLFDGLLDVDRRPHFKQVLAALKPDIITFNECWDMTAQQAASLVNEALPLGNFQSWKSAKLVDGNITVSRWPILENWAFYPGHRLHASLIDLPNDQYDKDFLVINGHLRCCSANAERQLEVDAFANFIQDAKSPGGEIELPEGTPFVLSGDMNLVGWRQQYTTLVSGDIVNNNVFGNDAPLDWDGTDLLDVLALQADQRMAHTWQEEGSQYPPSRLDFQFCSNSVLEMKKAFVLNTAIMPPDRLDLYGLESDNTFLAADHLPLVADFEVIGMTESTVVAEQKKSIVASPNPVTDYSMLNWKQPQAGEVIFALRQMDGRLLRSWKAFYGEGDALQMIDLQGLPNGTFFIEMNMEGNMRGVVLVKR
jgi:endonuclease/exonuclease/phosphatase family metal-dependent hydrolase